MSADNLFYIRKCPDGRWAAQEDFASTYGPPLPLRVGDPLFDTMEDALDYAYEQYSEYGVSTGPDVSRDEWEAYTKATGRAPVARWQSSQYRS